METKKRKQLEASGWTVGNADEFLEGEKIGGEQLLQAAFEAIARGGMDIKLCRVCGQPVVCLPDGPRVCVDCLPVADSDE